MEHDRVRAEREARPSFGRRRSGYQLRGHAEPGQDLVHLLLQAGRPVVDRARVTHELLARLVGQLAPQHLGLPGQPNVERVRVGAPEDPGGAVRTAAPVPGLRRLQQHHRTSPAGQGARRGRPGQPGTDDDHVRLFRTHGPTVTAWPAVTLARRGSGWQATPSERAYYVYTLMIGFNLLSVTA